MSKGIQIDGQIMFFSYLTLKQERGQGQNFNPVHIVFNVVSLCYKFEVLVLKGTQGMA